ncbi:MAG: peptidyl-tRNA hydrolase Pth2 [Promethearchaeia archaeon]
MPMNYDYKQVILIRTDLGMSTGKKCAQACHAAVSAADLVRRGKRSIWKTWKRAGQKKVILKVKALKDLQEIIDQLKQKDIPHFMVQDAGLTQLTPGTITALGIGPLKSREVDPITGNLKLL